MGKWLLTLKRVFASPEKETDTFASCDSVLLHSNESETATPIKKRRWGFGISTRQAILQGAKIAAKEPINSVGGKRRNHSAPSNGLALYSVRVKLVAPLDLQANREEKAATVIQRSLRGFLARRHFRALKASMRLKSLLRGDKVMLQARETLRGMQVLVKVQAHVRALRADRSERNMSIQRQVWHRRQQERRYIKAILEGRSREDDWNDSSESLEETQIKLRRKERGSLSRERAFEYAWIHQLSRNFPKHGDEEGKATMPQWDWSWSSSWLSPRPWDSCSIPSSTNDVQHAIPDFLMEKLLGRTGIESCARSGLSSNCLLAKYKCASIGPECHTLKPS